MRRLCLIGRGRGLANAHIQEMLPYASVDLVEGDGEGYGYVSDGVSLSCEHDEVAVWGYGCVACETVRPVIVCCGSFLSL